MKIVPIAVAGAATFVASANAGFLGFVAFAKQSGSYVLVDVFTAVQNSSDKFLNVYNLNASATGGFYQASGMTYKTWKPDAAGFTSTRSSVDSFMTAGTYSGGAYGGEYYASANTNGDPNFTSVGGAWNATPASALANSIPSLSGWYTGDPTSVDNQAEALSGVTGTRVNSVATAGSGGTASTVGSAGAAYGIWCGHLCLANTTVAAVTAGIANGTVMQWNGAASVKDGTTGSTSQGQSQFIVPTPGAIALAGIAGLRSRRRR